jgi:hypothetical protein
VSKHGKTVEGPVEVMRPVIELRQITVDVPDIVLMSPATYAALYSGSFDPAGPAKRRLDSGALLVVSMYVPAGEAHVMRGSALVEKVVVGG